MGGLCFVGCEEGPNVFSIDAMTGDFGLKQVIRIGHMAGRSNIIWWLEQNGYEASDDLVAHVFEVAKTQRRNMEDQEVKDTVESFLNA